MHPAQVFAWADEAAMRDFVTARGFAQISVAIDGRVECAHAPLVEAADGSFRFHLARTNPLVAQLESRAVFATVLGEDAYISPDWYGTEDQVPTWNYRLVEIRGTGRRIDDAALVAQLDAVSTAQEAQLLPKTPWTSGKMSPGRLDAMARAVVGFAIEAPVLCGLRKLGQNKTSAERAGAISALHALGRKDFADLMEQA